MSNNTFRSICAAASFALTVAAAPIAQADPTFHTTGSAVGAQQFGLSIGGSPSAGGYKGTWNGDSIIFWTIEVNQPFGYGYDYTYSASLPNNAMFGLLGKLFTQAYGSALIDASHSAAFQLAIWEIVHDSANLNLSGGAFKVQNSYGRPETVALAQQWLDGLASMQDKYDLYLLSDGFHNFITTHQVVPTPRAVPEPSTLMLLGLALAAAWWFGRRRKAVGPA